MNPFVQAPTAGSTTSSSNLDKFASLLEAHQPRQVATALLMLTSLPPLTVASPPFGSWMELRCPRRQDRGGRRRGCVRAVAARRLAPVLEASTLAIQLFDEGHPVVPRKPVILR